MKSRKYKCISGVIALAVGLCFLGQVTFAQAVQTITNKKDILIGEQIQIKIKVDLPVQSKPLKNWLNIPDSLKHFDVVEAGKVDAIGFKDNSRNIEQVITITSFDSGRWVFPALPIAFGLAAGPEQIIFTDSFYVNVGYAPADTSNALRDIKPIMEVKVASYFWYYVAAGFIALMVICYLLYRYFKKPRANMPGKSVSGLSPYDEAMEALKDLAGFDLTESKALKQFYSQLAAIFKQYVSRRYNKNMQNQTTDDLLITMKEKYLPHNNISELATALRCTDAVKFAKYIPETVHSEVCKQQIIITIQAIENKNKL